MSFIGSHVSIEPQYQTGTLFDFVSFFRKFYLLYVVRVKAAPQSKKFFCHYTGRLQLKYSFHVSQRWHPLINFVLGVGFSHGWLDGLAMLNPVWGPARPFPVLPKWLTALVQGFIVLDKAGSYQKYLQHEQTT